MLVLATNLYQFDVTVGNLSSLNSLPLLTLACDFVHLLCQVHFILYHRFSVTSLLFLCFWGLLLPFLFISLALQYTPVFALLCLVYHYSILFRCLQLYSFYLTVFTLHLFMVTSGLKCIRFNLLNVNVHIFIIAVYSLENWIISQYSLTTQ